MKQLFERFLKEDEFEDIFQPISKEEHFKRLGFTKNPDGTWTADGIIFDPRKKPKFPILSHRYEKSVFNLGALKEIPARATSFKKAIAFLEERGVDWIEFSRLRYFGLSLCVKAGYQIVGNYKDKIVMLETKVGVSTNSAGYLVLVCPKEEVQSGRSVATANMTSALEVISRKLGLEHSLISIRRRARQAKRKCEKAKYYYYKLLSENPEVKKARDAFYSSTDAGKPDYARSYEILKKAEQTAMEKDPKVIQAYQAYKEAEEELVKASKAEGEAKRSFYVTERFDPGRFPSFVFPAKKSWIELGDEQLNEIVPDLSDNEKTYLEMIASNEYQQMLSRLEKYTGLVISKADLPQIVSLYGQALQKVLGIEYTNKSYLENIALEVVLDLPEFKMVKDAYENGDLFFDVKLGSTELRVSVPSVEVEQELSKAEEMNTELAKEFEELDKESDLRRRLANLFIQGMATSRMYLFNLVVDKLNKINPSLVNLYGLVAASTQLGYWVSPSGVERQAAGKRVTIGGSSEVIPKGDDYVIKARAIIFPFLLHEIVKGIYEWLSVDPDLKAAMKRIDSIEAETGDIILGPGFAKTFQKLIPVEKYEYIPLIYRKFLQLSKEDIKSVLTQSEKGRKILNDLLREAELEWKEYKKERSRYEYEDSV